MGESFLTTLASNRSILEWPQEVDFFGNDQVTGFHTYHQYPTNFFVGVEGDDPYQTFGEGDSGGTELYENTDYGNFPGPMDNW